jgi:hypothetical protein
MTSAEPIESNPTFSEARAKIIWGESAASVRAFLIVNNVSAAEADAKVKQFVRERNAELRVIGIRRVLIGTPLVLLSIFLTWYMLTDHSNVYNRTNNRGLGGVFLMGLFGLWKLIGGLFFLLRPQSDDESIADIEE